MSLYLFSFTRKSISIVILGETFFLSFRSIFIPFMVFTLVTRRDIVFPIKNSIFIRTNSVIENSQSNNWCTSGKFSIVALHIWIIGLIPLASMHIEWYFMSIQSKLNSSMISAKPRKMREKILFPLLMMRLDEFFGFQKIHFDFYFIFFLVLWNEKEEEILVSSLQSLFSLCSSFARQFQINIFLLLLYFSFWYVFRYSSFMIYIADRPCFCR